MQLTCQESMISADTLLDKCTILQEAGFTGIDLPGSTLKGRVKEMKHATKVTGIQPAAVYSQLGRPGASLLDLTVRTRFYAMDLFKERMEATAEVGAESLIFVPVFGDPMIRPEAEKWMLVTMLDELAEWAQGVPVTMVLEPLNQKETHFIYDPRKSVEIVNMVNRLNVMSMIDTYHMDMEKQDALEMIEVTGSYLSIVHLSDTNRALPGDGEIDFNNILQILHSRGFNGPLGLECKGQSSNEELSNTATRIKEMWKSD